MISEKLAQCATKTRHLFIASWEQKVPIDVQSADSDLLQRCLPPQLLGTTIKPLHVDKTGILLG